MTTMEHVQATYLLTASRLSETLTAVSDRDSVNDIVLVEVSRGDGLHGY